jgi:hypothetical protein
MSKGTFAIVFAGQLVEGFSVEQVQVNFAKLFKVKPSSIAPMFSGKPVAIKKGLDEATAKKYQQVMSKAGALVRAVDLATLAKKQAPAAQIAATQEPSAVQELTLAEPGVQIVPPEKFEALKIDTAHFDMAAAGATLIEARVFVPLDVDISALSMAEPGAQIVQPEVIEALEVDTAQLSMAEPGVNLIKSSEMEPLNVDTSALSMAEPGVTLVKAETYVPADIDTSQLSLS